MKVDDQVAFLQGHKTGIGVGTPARLIELIDNGKLLLPSKYQCRHTDSKSGALSLDNLERVVVDASHIDQKKRGVMDMKDTMMPLARFLARGEFKEKYVDDEKKLALLFY